MKEFKNKLSEIHEASEIFYKHLSICPGSRGKYSSNGHFLEFFAVTYSE